MNRTRAKELLPIIQAYADGKTIQYRISPLDEWCDFTETFGNFRTDIEYRIKPVDFSASNCVRTENNSDVTPCGVEEKVKRTERGWAGHFICADSCKFRRNTLLEYNDKAIVVSTVVAMYLNGKLEEIGCNRHYETMAFYVDKDSGEYKDADVSNQVYFDSQWAMKWHKGYPDNEANEMHENVVKELTEKLLRGEV